MHAVGVADALDEERADVPDVLAADQIEMEARVALARREQQRLARHGWR